MKRVIALLLCCVVLAFSGCADGGDLSVSGRIPDGGQYWQQTETRMVVYDKGDVFPERMCKNDRFYFGDYLYTYSLGDGGWKVSLNGDVVSRDWETYGPILAYINGKPVISLDGTFANCGGIKNLKWLVVPKTVRSMNETFRGCVSLTDTSGLTPHKNLTSCWGIFDGCPIPTEQKKVFDERARLFASKVFEFEVMRTYEQTRTLYDKILRLDYRVAEGIEDPLLIAPEYETLLSQINNLLIQCQATSVSPKYKQVHSMMQTWIGTDAAVYCQCMSKAISQNNSQEAAKAREFQNLMQSDFRAITEQVLLLGAEVNYSGVEEVESWYFKLLGIEPTEPSGPNDSTPNWWEVTSLPQADPEWVLDPEIPSNYIPVPGESDLFMIIDQDGIIMEYVRRVKQADGSWLWEYNVNPNIPDNYEAVPGLVDVYKVVAEDGIIKYYKYIRNEDDTFAFVEVDRYGKKLNPVEEDDSGIIPDNYRLIRNNVYGVYNEHGVCTGYKKRMYDEATGKYYWIDAQSPNDETTNEKLVVAERYTETTISGGWQIITETIVTKTYSPDGRLISTKKDGPNEISRTPVGDNTDQNIPDPSKIASTLSGEYARVKVGLSYKTSLANEVLSIINTERMAAGQSGFVMSSSSNAYLLAAIRASDMAIYRHSDIDSPMYGTLQETVSRFGVASGSAYERMWRCSSGKTAEQIASQLLRMDDKLASSGYSDIGLVIVSKGGYYYIDLVIFG